MYAKTLTHAATALKKRKRAMSRSVFAALALWVHSHPVHAEIRTEPAAPLRSEENAVPAIQQITPPTAVTPIDLTRQQDDLWERIRNGFAMQDLQNPIVQSYEQRYRNQPEYLRRMVERSRRYMYHIVGELEKRGMPTEIALLPMVESAMNPMAYSHAHASGLWQFIPSTGKTYNLAQDWWKDERRDVVASTNAALDYLQTIYDLHGDWHLALASYNWGENAVARAIRKNESLGLPTDYDSLNMPKETKHYVPKLQALKNIFANPALVAQLNLPVVQNQPYFATVTPPSAIDVKVAARLANMPVDEFVALNPAHNRPVIKAESKLVLPAEKVTTFWDNLKAYAQPLASWQTYTLKIGEGLDALASRFGIAQADLKRVNSLHPQAKLSAGHTLLVPATEVTPSDPVSATTENPFASNANAFASATARAFAPAAVAVAAAAATNKVASVQRTHVVGKGETLAQVAKQHGMSLGEIVRLNSGLRASSKLSQGMKLALAAPSLTTTDISVESRSRGVRGRHSVPSVKLHSRTPAPAAHFQKVRGSGVVKEKHAPAKASRRR